MTLYLSKDELTEMTGYRQRSRIVEALARMGVPFKLRARDGFPLVERKVEGPRQQPRWEYAYVKTTN